MSGIIARKIGRQPLVGYGAIAFKFLAPEQNLWEHIGSGNAPKVRYTRSA